MYNQNISNSYTQILINDKRFFDCISKSYQVTTSKDLRMRFRDTSNVSKYKISYSSCVDRFFPRMSQDEIYARFDNIFKFIYSWHKMSQKNHFCYNRIGQRFSGVPVGAVHIRDPDDCQA